MKELHLAEGTVRHEKRVGVGTLFWKVGCMTIEAVKRELGSGVLAGCVVVLQCVVAWAAAFLVYQGLSLLF